MTRRYIDTRHVPWSVRPLEYFGAVSQIPYSVPSFFIEVRILMLMWRRNPTKRIMKVMYVRDSTEVTSL